MAFEGLATPLGMKPRASRKEGLLSGRRVGLVVFGLVLVGIPTTLYLGRGVKTGDAVAIAPIERKSPAPSEATSPPKRLDIKPDERESAESPLPSRSAAQEIEMASGVKVVRQNGGTVPGAAVIRVHEPLNAAALSPAPDQRVSERAQHGILPRMGEKGLSPRGLYARPHVPSGNPMIAVVLTGVGINARGTADAISRLPGAVTLAFAPYGRDLEAQVLRARRDGHEVMLQVPMEPFDFPSNDPGPHTLRAAGSPPENIERLHWLMTRFSGYVGVMNFMGGKLLSTDAAYKPVLEEINRRGLLFLDDGSVRKTSTIDLAGKIGLPAIRADRILENAGGAGALRGLLGEAEALARKSGRAVIAVPALPAHIEALAAWETELATRGLDLAPLSAVAGGGKK